MTTLREIVRTCSNAHVARAALASIGGEFARWFAANASRRDIPTGVLAAELVRDFALRADDEEKESVNEVVRGADQPILAGLRYILDRALRAEEDDSSTDDLPEEIPPAWAICASRAAIWRE